MSHPPEHGMGREAPDVAREIGGRQQNKGKRCGQIGGPVTPGGRLPERLMFRPEHACDDQAKTGHGYQTEEARSFGYICQRPCRENVIPAPFMNITSRGSAKWTIRITGLISSGKNGGVLTDYRPYMVPSLKAISYPFQGLHTIRRELNSVGQTLRCWHKLAPDHSSREPSRRQAQTHG